MEEAMIYDYLNQIIPYLEEILSNQLQLLDRLHSYAGLILMGVASAIGIGVVVFIGRALWRLVRF